MNLVAMENKGKTQPVSQIDDIFHFQQKELDHKGKSLMNALYILQLGIWDKAKSNSEQIKSMHIALHYAWPELCRIFHRTF